jgi:hypothetical protein
VQFLDYTDVLSGEPASFAVLATYQFDPDYFERRVLTTPALSGARRVLVFMDGSEWTKLLGQDFPARYINRRYLVVPVSRRGGVFHPKLTFLLRDDGATICCGSNNLTRSGCSRNLELLNCIRIDLDSIDQNYLALARDVVSFFKHACDGTEGPIGRLARKWIDEAIETNEWLSAKERPTKDQQIRFVHTYQGGLWPVVSRHLANDPPKRLLVISPFYDANDAMVRRIAKTWPKCTIELLVQQSTTNLDVEPLRTIEKQVSLSEISNSSRRLHAKLVAWDTANGVGCIAGSANCTTAAFDGRNVEACLLMVEAKEGVKALFDPGLNKRALDIDEFEPGTQVEEEPGAEVPRQLELKSALLADDGTLQLSFRNGLGSEAVLHTEIRVPGEKHPRIAITTPSRRNGEVTLNVPEDSLSGVGVTLIAALVADIGGRREESLPTWIIQEAQLTYEASGSSSGKGSDRIEETGEGLAEYLEELGKREGVAAVIEYLRRLNIRFDDAVAKGWGARRFRVRIRDPFRPDTDPPDWRAIAGDDLESLAVALFEFVDRHEHQRLRRHAQRGNINGIENFLSILTTLVKVLCVYYKAGVVFRGHLIHRFRNYIALATDGNYEDSDLDRGYVDAVVENLEGDLAAVREAAKGLNLFGHLWAILLIAQQARSKAEAKASKRKQPREFLLDSRDQIVRTERKAGIAGSGTGAVAEALRSYEMLTETEIAELLSEFVI